MSKRKLSLLVPVFGAAILVSGSIGDKLYAENNARLSATGFVGAARIVPQKAILAISISTDGVGWSQLDRFHTPKTRKIVNRAIASFQKEVFPKNDFEKEIQPWLGNVTAAVLPKNRRASQHKRKDESTWLVIIEVKDRESANRFMGKEKVRDGGYIVEQKDYKGIQITQINYGNEKPNIYAFFDNYLVFAEEKTSLETAIDTYKGGASIASSLGTDDRDLKNPVLQFYMPNFPEAIRQWMEMDTSFAKLPPQFFTQLKVIKSVNFGIGIDSDGIRLKGKTRLATDYRIDLSPSSGNPIAQFPSETFTLMTGSNIKARWQQLLRDIEKWPELKEVLDEIRQNIKSSPLAIDLDKDIFGWMDGEYAFGGIASNEGILAGIGAAPAFLIQTSNRPAAEALWKKLDEFANSNGFVKVEARNVKGVPVIEWRIDGSSEPIVSRGWSNKDTFFITAGPLVNTLLSTTETPLTTSSDFRAATGSLVKPNLGYFYLDMDKTWNLIRGKFPSDEESWIAPEAIAILGRVRGIGATVSLSDPSTSNFEFLLALKQRGLRGVWY